MSRDQDLIHHGLQFEGQQKLHQYQIYYCSTAEYLVREVLGQKKKEFFEKGLFKPGKSWKEGTNRKGN